MGDRSVIRKREDLTLEYDGEDYALNAFAPLYWAFRTPMQYVQTVTKQNVRNEDLVFLVYKASALDDADGVHILTSDGNAAKHETEFHHRWEAYEHLDWDILQCNKCLSDEWKRKKMAEVLVLDKIPAWLVDHICVYSHSAKIRLEENYDEFESNSNESLHRMQSAVLALQLMAQEDGKLPVHVRPDMYCR